MTPCGRGEGGGLPDTTRTLTALLGSGVSAGVLVPALLWADGATRPGCSPLGHGATWGPVLVLVAAAAAGGPMAAMVMSPAAPTR